MGYYKTQADNLYRLTNSATVLLALAEQGEFTSKTYNTLRKKRETCSLDFLDWKGIIEKVREEKFTVKVKNATYRSGIFTEDGTKVCEEYEWSRVPTNVREMLQKQYGELFVGWEDSTVEAKRYYYKVNTTKLYAVLEDLRRTTSRHILSQYEKSKREFERYSVLRELLA